MTATAQHRSAVYLDQHGFPAYVEDTRRGPQPADLVVGMERVGIDAERIDPSDIFRLMVARTWATPQEDAK